MLEIFNRTFGNGYMKLQKVALIDEFYGYHLGLIIFAANLKLLKILSFNNKMSLLIYTLAKCVISTTKQCKWYFFVYRCWEDLYGFLGIFFLAFGAFVQMFYLILNCDLPEFKNVIIAFETCFTIMLNKFDFGKIKVSLLGTSKTHLKHHKWTGN